MTEGEQIEAVLEAMNQLRTSLCEKGMMHPTNPARIAFEVVEKYLAAPALVRRVKELEDWQAKVVEILKRLENKMLATDPEKWLDYEKQLATLTALIEQAEGGKE